MENTVSPLVDQRDEGGSDCFLDSRLPMPAADSVAALIVVDSTEYLLQLRDKEPAIYFADHWGLFGGAVEPGEKPEAALFRELQEELGFRPAHLEYFTEFHFDLRVIGEMPVYRRFYEATIARDQLTGLTLTEGRSLGSFNAQNAFRLRLTPYDSFALWLHHLKRTAG